MTTYCGMGKREEGIYIFKAGENTALNLVVGGKTIRLAEFPDFKNASNFAFSIQKLNEELKIFMIEET